MPTTRDQEPEDERDELAGEAEATAEPRRRRRLRTVVRESVYDFAHPPAARWSAPGEGRVRTRVQKMTDALDRSPRLRVGVVLATVVMVVVLGVLGWLLLFTPSGDSEPPQEPAATQEALPSQSEAADSEPAQPNTPVTPSKTAKPAGEVADDAMLGRINDNYGSSVVSARGEDEKDPLATGARFLRSLRTVDTTQDTVEDWYQARDSFLAGASGGGQSGWGDAGEDRAISNAEVSWARMDAAIAEEQGIAPTFAYGPQVQPGTHLVQVGLRLERSVARGDGRLDTPSGALMEAVVSCPPASSEDHCVVTNWAETPGEFVGERESSWKAATS